MNVEGTRAVLRPLGVGEVLDRAVTLSVKNFVVLATIFVVYAIPLGIAQFFASQGLVGMLSKIQVSLAASSAAGKPADPAALAHAFASLGSVGGWYPAFILVAFLISPLPTAALIEACTALYLGRATTFALAYRTALERWSKLIALGLLYMASGIALYVVVLILVFVLAFAIAFVTSAVKTLGIALAVGVVVLATVASIAFFIVAALAWQVSYFTCVVEGAGPVASFRLGLRRVFVGVGPKRSMLVGLAFFAILIGIALVTLVGEATLAAVTHSPLVGTIYETLVRVATAAFTTAFIAIFYFDLRVREEGLDLQLDAARARGTPVPTV